MMLLAILLCSNYFGFLMNQAILPKSGLQPQLIRHNTSVDGDAPNQSLVLSVNGL